MKKASFAATLLLSGAVYVMPPVQADVLLIEKIHTTQGAEVPPSGLSMAQVETRFGTPSNKLDAIGDPPISRWIYPTYTVYFEFQTVIDSVVHPQVAGLTDPDS